MMIIINKNTLCIFWGGAKDISELLLLIRFFAGIFSFFSRSCKNVEGEFSLVFPGKVNNKCLRRFNEIIECFHVIIVK